MNEIDVVSEYSKELERVNEMTWKHRLPRLRIEFLKELNNISYIVHFLCFIKDESIVVLILKCMVQFVVGQKLDGKQLNDIGFLGASNNEQQANDSSTEIQNFANLRRHTQQAILGSNNVSHNEEDDIPLSMVSRKLFLWRIISCLIMVWGFIIIFQFFFCCGNTYSRSSFSLFGNFRTLNKTQWKANDAFSYGNIAIVIIGENKASNWILKFMLLLMLDSISLFFQLSLVIFNTAIGFKLMEGLTPPITNAFNSSEGHDINIIQGTNLPLKEYDGLQGNIKIYRFYPKMFLHLMKIVKEDDLVSEYLAEHGPVGNSSISGFPNIV